MENKKVFIIKLIHAILFLLLVFCLFDVLFIAIARRYDWTLFPAMGIIAFDGIVILFNRGRCPLTTLAERYGAKNGAVTSIFLPKFLARYVFKFFGVLSSVELILLGWWYFS
ncbi:MAG: hypothetical protein A2137_02960 [Chloroflexi bacterium RBG_16_58_8]|nr:MAG: hypothetical protein A2137_02960 [Chloroflexi bacterium RBG_16_58_8]